MKTKRLQLPQSPEGIKLYSVYRSDLDSLNEVAAHWARMEDWQRERWDKLADWVRGIADQARAYGYEQGERGGASRMRVRPGDGDMGG